MEIKGKQENMLAGVVGALVGAAIGGGSILLLGQLGYVAALSGLILAVCTLKGYELLGGRLSGKGIAVCVVLMLVTPYFADRLDWAISLKNELARYDYYMTLGEVYSAIPGFLAEDLIDATAYYMNLAMIYAFLLLGGFSTVHRTLKARKAEEEAQDLI